MPGVLSLPNPIARLNDAVRTTFIGGRIMLTATVAALPDATKANILTAVRNFSEFTEDNDPEGNHDYGSFTIDGERYCFKFDYYDKPMKYGSPDPADPSVTTRVLTIMHVSDW